MADRQDNGGRPDLVRNYRPVAIRSVVAAHAMIAKVRPGVPPAPQAGFSLPPGFHGMAEGEP